MSTRRAAPSKLVRHLYRSLLRYGKRLDASPIHRSFLIVPRSYYESKSLDQRADTKEKDDSDIRIVEDLIDELNKGRWYRPSARESKEESRSITTRIREYFRSGIRTHEKDKPLYSMELGLYGLKLLANGHDWLKTFLAYDTKLWEWGGGIRSEYMDEASERIWSSRGQWTKVSCLNESKDEQYLQKLYKMRSTKVVNLSEFSGLEKGMLLCSHPMASLNGRVNRQVIFISDVTPKAVRGIVLNTPGFVFTAQDDNNNNNNNNNDKTEDSVLQHGATSTRHIDPAWTLRSWLQGEYNYVGGHAVNQLIVASLLHNQPVLLSQFPMVSTRLVATRNVFLTHITKNNLDEIVQCLHPALHKGLSTSPITVKVVHKNCVWDTYTLLCQIRRGEWLGPLIINDECEMEALLMLSCFHPRFESDYKHRKKPVPAKSELQFATEYNRIVWQWVVNSVGGEYRNISLFPHSSLLCSKTSSFLSDELSSSVFFQFNNDKSLSSSPLQTKHVDDSDNVEHISTLAGHDHRDTNSPLQRRHDEKQSDSSIASQTPPPKKKSNEIKTKDIHYKSNFEVPYFILISYAMAFIL
ncbi:hypothetical protein RFI_29774 [Reticulomyxa filosa]|uniref:Uncharacterized protein n=1 Tax=Reticulomyxa filosa TaxID=46433 RepID=X6M2H2_RETFI|nr:hypothetical protein RFI_29774 [Reticulomyxa filosa]|eukprot:ETO07617.1 hypothetical protein RFI_29774 [Reticulomyxa filosa]